MVLWCSGWACGEVDGPWWSRWARRVVDGARGVVVGPVVYGWALCSVVDG